MSGGRNSGRSGKPRKKTRRPGRARQAPARPGDTASGGDSRPARGDSRPARGGKNVGRPRTKRGLGGDQVEGRQAVRELLLAGTRQVREVLMAEELSDADVLIDIEHLSQELGVGFRKVSRRHLSSEALTESHQGVIARAAPLVAADFDRLLADPRAFLLVLDGITDPGNLGAILRTAECAGVTGVVLGRHRSVHISPTVTKTAAGAIEHVPLALVGGIPTAVSQLNDAGVVTIGLDGGAPASLFDVKHIDSAPVALVLGAEGPGMSRLVRQRVSHLVSIPLVGKLNSLNVAMASAVACFEVVRLRTNSKD